MIRMFYFVTTGAKHIRAVSATLGMHGNGGQEDEAVEDLRSKIKAKYPGQAVRLLKVEKPKGKVPNHQQQGKKSQ